MVVFQPLTGDTQVLESATIVKTFLVSLPHPSQLFSWYFVSLPGPTSYWYPMCRQSTPLHYICCTWFFTLTISDMDWLSTRTLPPPASLRRLSLRFHPLPYSTFCLGRSWSLEYGSACLCLLCPSSVCLPFAAIFLIPGPCHTLGVLTYDGKPLPLPGYVAIKSAPPILASAHNPVPSGPGVFAPCSFCPPVPSSYSSPTLCSALSLGVFWWLVSSSGVLLR